MKIAILGAGPSGLMAAWASLQCGHKFDLYDRDPFSNNHSHGVFYLHKHCDLPVSEQRITTMITPRRGIGIEEAKMRYAEKVYGDPSIPVSLHRGPSVVFNAEEGFQQLQGLFSNDVKKVTFTDFAEVTDLLIRYDRVFVTIPARIFLEGAFRSRGAFVRVSRRPQGGPYGYVIYNAGEHPWTRLSHVFGVQVIESPESIEGGISIRKVITEPRETFSNLPPEILWLGRYGAWDKSILTHSIYDRLLMEL